MMSTAVTLECADFCTLFDHYPDACMLWDPYRDEVIAANAPAGELLGCSCAELVGRRPSALHPGERGALIVFSESVLYSGIGWTDGLSILHRDGSRIGVEYSARRTVISGRDLILVSVRDLTTRGNRQTQSKADAYVRDGIAEWRRVQQLFADIEHENRLILQAAGEGIYGVDANGVTTFVNPAAERMLGYRADELVGRKMHSAIHHSHADGSRYNESECAIYAAFCDGIVHRRDTEVFWRKDGSPFPVEYTSTPLRDRGQVVGAVVVFRDISDRRAAEQQLHTALTELEALKHRLQLENDYLQEELREETNYHEIVGRSRAVREVIKKIELVAPTDAAVLINGESGTGKELIARAIHARSRRSERPLFRVNCAAIPRDLFESEFFGHVRGAFTGATADRVGRFELADQGTLFLDEVGEIPLELQGKLLRVLQEGQFERVGDNRTQSVDVRIVAATNRALEQDIAAGRFREDLYYRLNVFPIASVALRERPEDIPTLASHFLAKACQRFGRDGLQLSRADVTALQRYDWPGNVRELENLIERAVIVSTGRRLRLELPETGSAPFPRLEPRAPLTEGEILTESQRRHRDRETIERALERTEGKIFGRGGAAELLGVKPTTLASRMKRLGIEKPRRNPRPHHPY